MKVRPNLFRMRMQRAALAVGSVSQKPKSAKSKSSLTVKEEDHGKG